MNVSKSVLVKQNVILFSMGFVGILASLPLMPQLLALQGEPPPLPLHALQLLSLLQASALLLGMVLLGSCFATRVKLASPVVQSVARSSGGLGKLKEIVLPAVIGGVVGGAGVLTFSEFFASYLPAEFLAAEKRFSSPWFTRILYGGITEEILVRWGLMSFLAWCCFRLTQEKGTRVRSHNYWMAIIVSALFFGVGHLPVVYLLSPVVDAPLVFYIIFGNGVFGFIAGFLFWRRGLECSILAHMVFHVTLLVGKTFT